ncbi:hypothetical protein BCIN_01g07390 [Botrytis cinerea B05.10]|uniref:Syndecan domain-containing protein n=3 Tax=Botryotinia fuckeliana TaxID=40559 RepID=A0A384J635_BOTFB|nr:hypothetical protein BCIN_01g07390 [Botrytis cinerea B05.10]ATZ46066.1 hypothetical protein BCIN_01g07390 [Botrytis cinerea B05.10]EMR84427.1 hypothetical protein BcDW1_6937 [Botrytis cinerea BcDW1]CCD45783.1 hypothetical protein BofuT4_P048010.1 [Botrytis cinerea T4]
MTNLFILFLFLITSEAITISKPPLHTPVSSVPVQLRARQTTSFASLCGYSNGDIEIPRTAEPGYACREDTVNNLWGFCPNTIAEATNCDFVGYCVDDGTCSTGCGRSSLTQLHCTNAMPYCSTALLVSEEQTYTYLTCATSPTTNFYLVNPTSNSVSTVSSASTSQVSTTQYYSTIVGATSSSAPSAQSTSAQSTSAKASPNNVGAIVGGVLGGLALILLIVIALIFLKRYKPSTSLKGEKDTNGESMAFTGPIADNGGIHELYDYRKEARELDSTTSVMKGNSDLKSGILTGDETTRRNPAAVELDISP